MIMISVGNTSRFFKYMVESLLEDVLCCKSGEAGAYGHTNGYYRTVEQQGRLTLHLHLLLWVKGTLSPQDTKEKLLSDDSAWKQKLIRWLESCHQGDFLTGDLARVTKEKKFREQQEGYADPTETLPIPPPMPCAAHLLRMDNPDCQDCCRYQLWEDTYKDTVDDLLL